MFPLIEMGCVEAVCFPQRTTHPVSDLVAFVASEPIAPLPSLGPGYDAGFQLSTWPMLHALGFADEPSYYDMMWRPGQPRRVRGTNQYSVYRSYKRVLEYVSRYAIR